MANVRPGPQQQLDARRTNPIAAEFSLGSWCLLRLFLPAPAIGDGILEKISRVCAQWAPIGAGRVLEPLSRFAVNHDSNLNCVRHGQSLTLLFQQGVPRRARVSNALDERHAVATPFIIGSKKIPAALVRGRG